MPNRDNVSNQWGLQRKGGCGVNIYMQNTDSRNDSTRAVLEQLLLPMVSVAATFLCLQMLQHFLNCKTKQLPESRHLIDAFPGEKLGWQL